MTQTFIALLRGINVSGRSKLSPAVLDRLVGSAVTTRNWRTVVKLDEMVQSRLGKK